MPLWFQFRSLAGITRTCRTIAQSARFLSGSYWNVSFISGHNVLPNHQFGFRAAHSTSHQLNRVVRHVKNRRIVYWDASFGRRKGFCSGTMHFYINSFSGVARSLSVIFLFVCLRVPCCLQLFITSSLRMPPLSMGDWARYICQWHCTICVQFRPNGWTSGAARLTDWLHQTMEDKGDLSITQVTYFTRCWSPLRLSSFGIVLNWQKLPWTPEYKYLWVTLDKRLTFASHTAKSIETWFNCATSYHAQKKSFKSSRASVKIIKISSLAIFDIWSPPGDQMSFRLLAKNLLFYKNCIFSQQIFVVL
jgi:hypothetical protein